MHATQRVRLAGARTRAYPDVGLLRYANVDDHRHWHYLDFDRYELLRPDGTLVVRDRKPRAHALEEGLSVAFTDRYPANFHGQYLRLDGVPGSCATTATPRRCGPGCAGTPAARPVTILRACDSARCDPG